MSKIKFQYLGLLTLAGIIIIMVLCAGCTSEKTSLNLFAGAGLKKPMDVVIDHAGSEKGINVTPNYGPSGGLYIQIDQGQPCDIYYSADWLYIQKLIDAGKVAEAEKFLNEHVVMVVSKTGKEKGITTAADLTKKDMVVAVADPKAPVGAYSDNVLKSLGIYDTLNEMGNIRTRPSTVNQVALMVQNDEVDAGFIYSSTAKLYGLDVAESYSTEQSGEIIFGVAVIKGGNEAEAREFMKHAKENIAEFTQYGWEPYA